MAKRLCLIKDPPPPPTNHDADSRSPQDQALADLFLGLVVELAAAGEIVSTFLWK